MATAALAAGLALAACAGSGAERPGNGISQPDTSASHGAGGPGDAVVFGTVKVREGNCMPGPVPEPRDVRPDPCALQGVATTVGAYPPVSEGHRAADPEHPTVGAPLSTTRSAAGGMYELTLPAGRYSILADDEGKPYCNSFSTDGEGTLACVVEVKSGERVPFDITINHAFD
jgi:hypothetical protein